MYRQRQIRLSLILGLSLISMSGCKMDPEEQSRALAMSKDSIAALTPAQQNAYLATYKNNQRTKHATQIASQMNSSKALTVTLTQGSARMSPSYIQSPFSKGKMIIKANQCDTMTLKAYGNHKHTAQLSLCYLDDKLYVDASSIDPNYPVGSIIIPIMARMDGPQSFCQMASKGNAQLSNSCITVDAQNSELSLPTSLLTKAGKNQKFTAKTREIKGSDEDESIIDYSA